MKSSRSNSPSAKGIKGVRKTAPESARALRLHASFTLTMTKEAAKLNDAVAFQELCNDAQTLRNKIRSETLEARERHLQKLSAILDNSLPIWESRAAGTIDEKTTALRLREICPDEHTQTEVVEFILPALKKRLAMTDEEAAENERKMAADERALAKSRELINADEQAWQALEILSREVQAGEETAIQTIVSIAEQAITLLLTAEKLHPQITGRVAADRLQWPVMGSRERGWERKALKRLELLQLGRGLEFIRTSFREARGADENYPARLWAKAAVRTIEETRRRHLIFREYSEEFKQLVLEGKIDLDKTPKWTRQALQLPVLSTSTAREWGKVIRDLIREEMPGFQRAPEWSTQRNTAQKNCRDSRGEIQNAILDDITSALRRIAPPARVPKPGSRNSANE